jgi:hypothetical protein
MHSLPSLTSSVNMFLSSTLASSRSSLLSSRDKTLSASEHKLDDRRTIDSPTSPIKAVHVAVSIQDNVVVALTESPTKGGCVIRRRREKQLSKGRRCQRRTRASSTSSGSDDSNNGRSTSSRCLFKELEAGDLTVRSVAVHINASKAKTAGGKQAESA